MMVQRKINSASVAGSVLIFTLWILVCLTVISFGFAHRVRLETKATAYTVANIGSFYTAEGVLYEMAIKLIKNRRAGQAEPLPRYGGNGGGQEDEVRCQVIPEEAKLNVNVAPEQLIHDMEPLKGGVARAILKMRLGDDLKGGTDDDLLFRLPEELLMVEGIDPEKWYGEEDEEPGIRDLITVYGDGKIDLNSAPPEVIEAIPGVSRRVAEDIVAFRAGSDGTLGTGDDGRWDSFDEMGESLKLSEEQLGPFKKLCKFGSEYYTVRVAASKGGSRATAIITAVMRIGNDGFTLVAWRED